MALVTVMGAVLVLAMIGAGVALQAKSELRAGRLEPDVAQAQTLIWSGLQDAARQAANSGTFATGAPDPALSPASQGFTPCVPTAQGSPDPTGPSYCVDVLKRTTRFITIANANQSRDIVPVAVRWRVRESDPVRTAYGWLVIIPPTNVTVYYNHTWCRPKPTWDSDYCEQGG